MIYCVVPEPLADELLDKLTRYYADDPNVTVIVDRRKASRRERGSTAEDGRERRAEVGRHLGRGELAQRTDGGMLRGLDHAAAQTSASNVIWQKVDARSLPARVRHAHAIQPVSVPSSARDPKEDLRDCILPFGERLR